MDLQIKFSGYGHWKITTAYYGKKICCTTTNSMAIDDFNSDEFEREGRELRKKRGYNILRSEVVRNYKNSL